MIQEINFISIFEQLTANIILYLPRMASSLLVLFVGLKTYPFFAKIIKEFFDKHDYDESLEKFLQSLFGIGYRLFVILFSISIAGVGTASIVAALGAAGFAVGLALQGSMSNFASGILVLVLKPIKVGEYIEVLDKSGIVKHIEIFNTTLLTPNNTTIIIPNSDLTSKVLINYSRQKIKRIDYKIGVGYESDLKKVRKVFEKTISQYDDLVINNDTRSTFIGVSELGDSAVIFAVYVWCNTSDYWKLKHDLLEEIKIALDKAKINIPYQTITIAK
ncbi:MAG: mechanosensitive ion channel [Candidatus Pacebacteria bacterium]|nr:mechanosensitive ion channel [Candidatus Paceibacterota bacterium]